MHTYVRNYQRWVIMLKKETSETFKFWMPITNVHAIQESNDILTYLYKALKETQFNIPQKCIQTLWSAPFALKISLSTLY